MINGNAIKYVLLALAVALVSWNFKMVFDTWGTASNHEGRIRVLEQTYAAREIEDKLFQSEMRKSIADVLVTLNDVRIQIARGSPHAR
jgi:hypothetical protein